LGIRPAAAPFLQPDAFAAAPNRWAAQAIFTGGLCLAP